VVFTSDIDSTSLALWDRLLVLAPGETMAYFGPPTGGLSFDRLPHRYLGGWWGPAHGIAKVV
jgi:hypothetical protein